MAPVFPALTQGAAWRRPIVVGSTAQVRAKSASLEDAKAALAASWGAVHIGSDLIGNPRILICLFWGVATGQNSCRAEALQGGAVQMFRARAKAGKVR
jgi:hypothetical protein